MTFAQYKRLKPKYRRRIIGVAAAGFALFIALLYLLSFGIRAVRIQLNTTKLDGVTAVNVLEKESMSKILDAMGQPDPTNVRVIDSRLTVAGSGAVTELTMNLVYLSGTNSSEDWMLFANEKKAWVRKNIVKFANRNSLAMRKMEFQTYFPGLSRVSAPQFVQYLQDNENITPQCQLIFEDYFDDNIDPAYNSFLSAGRTGILVSKIGGVSSFAEGFERPYSCVSTLVSVRHVNENKTKGKKVVLEDPAEEFVILFEAAPY